MDAGQKPSVLLADVAALRIYRCWSCRRAAEINGSPIGAPRRRNSAFEPATRTWRANSSPARNGSRGVGATIRSTTPDRVARPASRQLPSPADCGRRSRPSRIDARRARRRRSPSSASNSARSSAAELERAVGRRDSAPCGRLTAPGNVPGDGIDRLDVAAKAFRCSAHRRASAMPLPRLASTRRRRRQSVRRRRIAKRGRGARRERRSLTGRPSRTHFAKPPSSTATASWPSQRSIHHSRDAYSAAALVVGDDLLASRRCRARRTSPRGRSGEGSGWRPLLPVVAPDRSRSRCGEDARRECAPRGTVRSPHVSGSARSCRTSTDHARPGASSVRRELGGRDRAWRTCTRYEAHAHASDARAELAPQELVEVLHAVFHRRLVGPDLAAARPCTARGGRRPCARRSRRPRAPFPCTPPARPRRIRARTARCLRDSRTRRRWSSCPRPRGISVLTTSTCGYHSTITFG